MAGQQGTVTLTGNLGMDPVGFSRDPNNPACSFNVGVSSGYFDQSSQSWRSRETVWIKVRAYRALAANAMRSLHKGDAVVVTGALRMDRWTKDGVNRTAIVMDASAVGHDLNYGTSAFSRSNRGQGGNGGPSGNGGDGPYTDGYADTRDGSNGVGSDPFAQGNAAVAQNAVQNSQNAQNMQNGGAPAGTTPNGMMPAGTPPNNIPSPNTGGQRYVAQGQSEPTVDPSDDPEF
ncbi:single-strand-binding family protein [Bifidobacterium sp. DSM 109960]|uniref:Single-stranded DNA-binding protein n=1 Tax=Bifidobacterium erythrocebi TaxID=2675325 RepID=A0A7Y0ESM5_9BIFI|nr:single-stranded DNA-binding protein [Bifidobacterium sp. DSM 109960]NMM95634.1 single-strand-binding family protein [Bifidobacterium sp. DSM 109960]